MESLLPTLDGAFPDRADAVVVGDEATSWEHLVARADATAANLTGARALAFMGTSSLDTIVAVVAGLRAGVPVVPVPPDSGEREGRHILSDSGADAVIDHDGRLSSWAGSDVVRLRVAESPNPGSVVSPGGSSMPAAVSDESTAIIMYTSGTTGAPKGVQIPRRAIRAGLDGLADAWGWTPADHLAHGLPLFHVHGLILGVLGPLRHGACLTHTVRPTPEGYAAAAGLGATMFFGVPTVWSRLVANESAARQLRGSRLLVSGSAALPTPVFDGIHRLTGCVPIERYGMTETMITLSTRADGDRRPGSVGVPIEGVRTALIDDEGNLMPHDGTTIGDLVVAGNTLFNGYLNLADVTAQSFISLSSHDRPELDGAVPDSDSLPAWFVTGDAATIDAGGMHRIVGRKSVDIIKSGGYKIGAGEIESVLLGIDGIDEVAVVGVPDADLGERVVAFVVGAPVVGDDEIIQTVADVLSIHKRPREIRHVDSLPRNAMGKVQKRSLVDG